MTGPVGPWDGVSELYEDDLDPAEKARIAAVVAASTTVTGDEVDPRQFYRRG